MEPYYYVIDQEHGMWKMDEAGYRALLACADIDSFPFGCHGRLVGRDALQVERRGLSVTLVHEAIRA